MGYSKYIGNSTRKGLLSLIRYYGGKYHQTPKYIPYILELANENKCYGYVEATGGGARTLLNLPKGQFSTKVYNEFDLGLCKLFKCVQNPSIVEELIRFLKYAPYDEGYFEWAKKKRNSVDCELVTSAALTYICAMQSRDGNMNDFKSAKDESTNIKYYKNIDRIRRITPALKDTVIMSADFRDMLEKFQDDKHILKFVDPPYHPSTRNRDALDVYSCELTIADHREMVNILVKSNSWILCGYDPAQYGSSDYRPLEEVGAIKQSIGFFNVGSSNKEELIDGKLKKEEFIWIKK